METIKFTMPKEMYNQMYFLFLNIKNSQYEDLKNTLDVFFKENIDDGISEEYILFTLKNAFESGEVMGVTVIDKTTLRLCNEWLKKVRKSDLANQIKEPITFSELFEPKYKDKLNILFERLMFNGYTDENNNWKFKSNTNEPAKLFHYLKNRNVIIAPKFKPSIECFYREFGCEIVEKDNGNPRATTRKNADESKNSINEVEFNNFLLTWI